MKFIKDEKEMIEPDYLKNLNTWYYHKNYNKYFEILRHILSAFSFLFIIIISIFKADKIPKEASVISSYFPGINIYFIYIMIFLICAVIFLLFHEFLHIAFIPHFYKNDKIYFCFRWRKSYPEIWNDNYEPMSKKRRFLQIAAPFFFLSVIPIIFMLVTPYRSFLLFVICVLHIIGCSSDIFHAYILTVNAPKNSIIINKYYKINDKK